MAANMVSVTPRATQPGHHFENGRRVSTLCTACFSKVRVCPSLSLNVMEPTVAESKLLVRNRHRPLFAAAAILSAGANRCFYLDTRRIASAMGSIAPGPRTDDHQESV